MDPKRQLGVLAIIRSLKLTRGPNVVILEHDHA